MTRIPRTTLLPALGFGLALLGALVVTLAGGGRPEARLREDVRGYLAALAAGDARAAAAWREDGQTAPEQQRAAELRGAHWALRDQALDAHAERARVRVVWIDRAGRERAETQIWRRVDGDGWRFVAVHG